jgi:AraC-like DNA-binding protein
MPKPLPEYLPDKVKMRLEKDSLSLKEISQNLGYSPNKLYGYFSSPHLKMRSYEFLARAGGLSLQSLQRLIKDGELEPYLATLKAKYHAQNYTQLARIIRVSNSWLYDLAGGKIDPSYLNDAYRIANALDLTIDDLYEISQPQF